MRRFELDATTNLTTNRTTQAFAADQGVPAGFVLVPVWWNPWLAAAYAASSAAAPAAALGSLN